MEQTTTVSTTNEVVIGEFFDQCEKASYIEFLREMFDAYITNWRFTDAHEHSRADDVFKYRAIEKLIESIN